MASSNSEAGAPRALSRKSRLHPGRLWTDQRATVLLLLLSFVYLCLFRRFTAMEPDEGILLQGAQRTLAGQVPYRDFFSFYTPGSYYELALVFRVFGSSLVVARIMLALTGAILSVIVYLLARRVCSQPLAVTMAALATASSLPYRFLVLHNWNSTLWACLALYCALRFVEHQHGKWTFALGSFVSITAMFDQAKGAGLGLGVAIGFLGIHWIQGRQFRFSRREILALVLGLVWPILVVSGYFASQHAIATMASDWLWPLNHYSAANRVPYGYQNWSDDVRHELFGTGSLPARGIKVLAIGPSLWIPVLPLVAAGLFIYWVVRSWQTRLSDELAAYYVILAAGYGGLALSTVMVRPDIIHFMYLQPLNCLVLAWILGGRNLPWRLLSTIRQPLAAYVIAALTMFSLAPLLGVLGTRDQIVTRRGVVTTQRKDTVLEYIQARVPAGETIVVYPYLPFYYYTTATFAPGRYDYFQPGMHTAEQASEMISDLTSRRVSGVLLETGFAEKLSHSWPNTPLAAVVKDPVVDYILQNYRVCQALTSPMDWRFVFMVRRDRSCP